MVDSGAPAAAGSKRVKPLAAKRLAAKASSADAIMALRNPPAYEADVVTMTPRAATPINPAVRATALLTPEATPECSTGTEFITVVVSGATKSAPPHPKIVAAGKKVAQ